MLLVSDLDDSSTDVGRVASVMLDYRRANVPLRVVALDPEPRDRATFAALLAGPDALTMAPDPRRARSPRVVCGTTGSSPPPSRQGACSRG